MTTKTTKPAYETEAEGDAYTHGYFEGRDAGLQDAFSAIAGLFPTPEQEATSGPGNWFAGREACSKSIIMLQGKKVGEKTLTAIHQWLKDAIAVSLIVIVILGLAFVLSGCSPAYSCRIDAWGRQHCESQAN